MDELRAARMLDDALTARESRDQGAPLDVAAGQPEINELLALASVLEKGLAPASPGRAAVDRTRTRVLNRVGAIRRPASRSMPQARRPTHLRRLAFAMVSLFLVFAILASGTGVAYAAGGSLPGDGLYGVKLGLESARLALTFSPEARGAFLRGLADERLSEIQTLLQVDREGDLPAAVDSYSHTLNELEQAAGAQDGPTLEQTRANLLHHLGVLQMLLTSAPERARAGLETAISKSHHGLDVIDALEQGMNPGQLAPGRVKKTPSADDGSGNGNQGKGPSADHTPGPPGGPPGKNGSPGNGNGPSTNHTPGPKGDPPGQNKGGGSGDSRGNH